MSVRKRKWKSSDGTEHEAWVIDVTYTPPGGRSERIRETSPAKSRRDAEAHERQIVSALLAGTYRKEVKEPKNELPTVAGFKDEFIAFARANNRPSEVVSKEKALNVHIIPFFGEKRLDEITTRDIERFKGELAKTLKPKSVKTYVGTLARMLRIAAKWGVIARAPEFESVKVPMPEFRFFTAEESRKLIDAADDEWRCMIVVALRTGMRLGELIALRWEDVDLKAARVFVRRSAYRGEVGPTKTGTNREVPLGDEVLAELTARRKVVKGQLVFPGRDGRLLTDRECRRPLERACRAAGLDEVGWHTLRHSFASQLTMAGAPMKAVQELLGHTQLTMTQRYSHLTPTVRRDAVRLLDGKGEGPRGTYGAHENTNPAVP